MPRKVPGAELRIGDATFYIAGDGNICAAMRVTRSRDLLFYIHTVHVHDMKRTSTLVAS